MAPHKAQYGLGALDASTPKSARAEQDDLAGKGRRRRRGPVSGNCSVLANFLRRSRMDAEP